MIQFYEPPKPIENRYIRFAKMGLDDIPERDPYTHKISFGKNISINVKSTRVKMFLTYKKRRCVCCGLETSFAAIESAPQTPDQKHLNFYGVDENGFEVLMTWDHIQPRSKGGKDSQSNAQCMCEVCNGIKGNSLSFDEVREERKRRLLPEYYYEIGETEIPKGDGIITEKESTKNPFEIFDSKCVKIEWEDSFSCQHFYVANSVNELKDIVNNARIDKARLIYNGSNENPDSPFKSSEGEYYKFLYYDKNYDVKVHYNLGYDIEWRRSSSELWTKWNPELDGEPCWNKQYYEYRIPPKVGNPRYDYNYLVDSFINGKVEYHQWHNWHDVTSIEHLKALYHDDYVEFRVKRKGYVPFNSFEEMLEVLGDYPSFVTLKGNEEKSFLNVRVNSYKRRKLDLSSDKYEDIVIIDLTEYSLIDMLNEFVIPCFNNGEITFKPFGKQAFYLP